MRYSFFCGLMGVVLGAAIPIAYGLQTMDAVSSAPPLPAGTAACGMPMLGAYLSIFLGGPLGAYCCGMIGLVIGALVDGAARIVNAVSDGIDMQ